MKRSYYLLLIGILVALYFYRSKLKIKRLYLSKVKDWKKRTSPIEDITIHHGASSFNVDWRNEWPKLHSNKWGFGIAYHYIIDDKGDIFQVNGDDKKTYHNGYNNDKAISICLVGNFENVQPKAEQVDSLIKLCNYLKRKYSSIKYLMSHKEYANKTRCSGKYLSSDMIRKSTNLKKRPIKKIAYLSSHSDN